ncbi:MAG: hypothetical protein QXJ96_01080 [Candidatus Aenigmatarchaeota archaeon]
MRIIDKIINEKVLWKDKPKYLPFFISSFFVFLFGFVFLLVGVLLTLKKVLVALLFPHNWVGLLFYNWLSFI